jgi:hypothetical protein
MLRTSLWAIRSDPDSLAKFVFEFQPFKLNQRLAAQQGLFLCPLSANVPFMDSLAATFALPPSVFSDAKTEEFKPPCDIKKFIEDVAVIKVLLPLAIHHDVLKDLRTMNVTAAALFPGLDGLARSLHYFLRIENLLEIKYLSGGFGPPAPATPSSP